MTPEPPPSEMRSASAVTNFQSTLEALRVFDLVQRASDEAVRRGAPTFFVDSLIKSLSQARRDVGEAFAVDTAAFNETDAAWRAPIWFIRRAVNGWLAELRASGPGICDGVSNDHAQQ